MAGFNSLILTCLSLHCFSLWVVAYLYSQSRAEVEVFCTWFYLALVNVGPQIFFFFSCETFGFPAITINFLGCSTASSLVLWLGKASWALGPLLCWHFWMISFFTFKTRRHEGKRKRETENSSVCFFLELCVYVFLCFCVCVDYVAQTNLEVTR